jgi:hypothetical protein
MKIRRHFLTNLRNHWLRIAGLPKVRQQEYRTRQPLLAAVEELAS